MMSSRGQSLARRVTFPATDGGHPVAPPPGVQHPLEQGRVPCVGHCLCVSRGATLPFVTAGGGLARCQGQGHGRPRRKEPLCCAQEELGGIPAPWPPVPVTSLQGQ